MRNPGRRDGDDARPDRCDQPAEEAGDDGAPADGGNLAARTPDGTSPAGPTALSTVNEPADDPPADDLLLDPLLCDEPIDLAAVHADDALIDALGGGDPDAALGLVDPDDPLIAMLAAWAASARPEAPEPDAGRPSLTLVGDDTARVTGGGAPEGTDTATALRPAAEGPGLATVVALTGTGRPVASARADVPAGDAPPGDGAPAACADLDAPTVRLDPTRATGSAVGAPDEVTAVTGGRRGRTPAAVVAVLARARVVRRRAGPGRPRPTDHPLRRAAVAVVVAALGVSAAAATGGTAQPGDVGFPITRVFFAERADSLEAAAVVQAGLDRARQYLENRQPGLAVRELEAVGTALPKVRAEEGHTELVDQQHTLADVVAVTPSDPTAPVAATTAATPGRNPDTSVLAEAAPRPNAGTQDSPAAGAAEGGAAIAQATVEAPAGDTSASGDAATTGSRSGTPDTSTTGKGTTGTGTAGTGATDTGTTDTGTTDPGATDPGATGPGATGPGATGPGATGEDATSSGATGKNATSKDSTGKDSTGKGSTGRSTTGEDTTSSGTTPGGDTPSGPVTAAVGGTSDKGSVTADPGRVDGGTTTTRPDTTGGTAAGTGADGASTANHPAGTSPTQTTTAPSTTPRPTNPRRPVGPAPTRGGKTRGGTTSGATVPAPDSGSGSAAAVPAGTDTKRMVVRPATHARPVDPPVVHTTVPAPVETTGADAPGPNPDR